MTQRVLLKTDGTQEKLPKLSINQISEKIGAAMIDSVNLADGYVMIVDDLGHKKDLPPNKLATFLYWEKCGGPVDHEIVGDVVVCPDADFGGTDGL